LSSSTVSFIYIIFLMAIFYFLLIRPQQQRAKQHRQLVSELKANDKVVTVGGIHGIVKSLTEDTVSLEIANGIIVTFSRSSIARIE